MSVAYDDLRGWIEGADDLGELRRLSGADWNQEIGAISSIYARHPGNAALLFDDIPGYPSGRRVLTNTLVSDRRIAFTLGAPSDAGGTDLVAHWRRLMKGVEGLAPKPVASGPIDDNRQEADKVDLLAFPAPKFHEHDGGRYLGTGCLVIMKDPGEPWVNLGTYRVMLHDEDRVGLYISPGKHGRLIRERYWDRGEPCPVAVSLGQDPLLTALGGIEVPYGVSEYDVAGWVRGRESEVIVSDLTGLPIPARAEIVIEGLLHPGDVEDEGPFGEWTGYYAGGRHPAPVVRVSRVRFRDDPVLLGMLAGRPPTDDTYYRGILRSAAIWDQLTAAGVPGITGVWVHEASGGRLWVSVAVKQMYPGHSRQAGLVASQCHAGAYANRFVVVVDDDIDVTDNTDVIWAMCTRVDVARDLTPLNDAWSSVLDPMAYPPEAPVYNSRLVVDATRPWHRLETFPRTVEPSPGYRSQIIAKWRDQLPGLG